MSILTIVLLAVGAVGIALFLYAELVILKVPFNELIVRKKERQRYRYD